jgi:hypothetical protein
MAAFVLSGQPDSYIGSVYENAKGNTECVTFVQAELPNVPKASFWRAGLKVAGNEAAIVVGTLIATFDENGLYPNKPAGNHAAFFLGKEDKYLKVLDQYKGSGGVKISRYPYPSDEERAAKKKSGKYSMTADAFTYCVVGVVPEDATK